MTESAKQEGDVPAGARELLLQTASDIMREGDIVDISLSELSLRSGLKSAKFAVLSMVSVDNRP